MSTRNIYGMNPKNKLYLFERLENAGTGETKDVWGHLDRGEYSIEHIMPQHLTAAWVTALGEEHEIIHMNWLHRLANLTLTAYNLFTGRRSVSVPVGIDIDSMARVFGVSWRWQAAST